MQLMLRRFQGFLLYYPVRLNSNFIFDMETLLICVMVGLMPLAATQATKCNGHEGLCKLKFDQASFAGTHNSGANRLLKYDTPIIMFPAWSCLYRNQDLSFTEQLDFGIRFFDIDTCPKDGAVWACHNGPFGRPLSEIIRDIANWLNEPSHKNEVVAMRFHDTTISGYGMFEPVFREHISGAGGKVGANPIKNDEWYNWPTLGEAVAENKRVFVFMVDKLCDYNCRRSYPYIRPATYDDTWQPRQLTFSCASMVSETREKCKGHHRALGQVSAFASMGLCNTELQRKCDPYIKPSTMACYEERKKSGSTVNFVIADYVNRAKPEENVITVTRKLNELNMQYFTGR